MNAKWRMIKMKIDNNARFGEPFQPYRESPMIRRIQLRDSGHNPYNKRPGSCKSILILEAQSNHNGDHLELKMEEITTTNGRTAGRTISTAINLDEAEKLANFILAAVAARKFKIIKNNS